MIVVKRGKEPNSLLEFRKKIRMRIMRICHQVCVQKCAGKSQDAYVHELERTYTSLVQERNLTPYCGIIISWLEGKLKK